MIVVGDVAGQYDTLIKLIEPFLGKEEIVLAGDLVDRGPKSREVVQFAINNKDNGVKAIIGNHEDMMIDWYFWNMDGNYNTAYEYDVWLNNGGYNTLISYGKNRSEQLINMKDHVYYLYNLPQTIEMNKVFVSHAPWNSSLIKRDKIWNRQEPDKMQDKLQIFGHNSMWGLIVYKDNETSKPYAICIDTSASKKLTCIKVDENTLDYDFFSQEYI